MVKTILYKAYVLALLGFVIWAAQLIYSLIFWEFELTGVENRVQLSAKDSEISRMKSVRKLMSNEITRHYDLGDVSMEEHYEEGHFHHVGQKVSEPILNGCDYCHTNIPHREGKEARAYRNMHGYFLACETCHFIYQFKPSEIEYNWINVETRQIMARPMQMMQSNSPANSNDVVSKKGNYGARIIPWIKSRRDPFSIIGNSELGEAKELFTGFENMDELELKSQLSRTHRGLTKKPLKCNACHTKKNPVIPYVWLGYSKKDAKKLKNAAVASVISEYNKFHFPNLFIRKDDRKQSSAGGK